VANCLIALGSNQGERAATITQALESLARHPRVSVETASRLYESPAIGGPAGQPAFLNAAARLQTDLTPWELLALLHETEGTLGRVRKQRWGARRIDLDLLLFDQRIIRTPTLVVPHPRMEFRRFVLVPAVEIAAQMTHPGTGWTLEGLLNHLDTAADYLAITGPPGSGKTQLAAELCRRQGWRLLVDPREEALAQRPDGNPAGSVLETELELLRVRTERLNACDTDWTSDEVVLSDFWLDQSAAYARRRLSGRLRETFEAAWLDARRYAMQPKVLVLLDAQEPSGGPLGPETAEMACPQRLRADLIGQVSLAGRGPLLRLDATDVAWAMGEIVAAVQAMRETVD
jgi:2-amino-4-hydroxy-6-hydroxymethyldihydropteridine diphosphokinase